MSSNRDDRANVVKPRAPLSITLRLAACSDPSARAVGADHLQVEFVRCAGVEGRLEGGPQPVPALGGIQLCVFLVAYGRQGRITAGEAIELV